MEGEQGRYREVLEVLADGRRDGSEGAHRGAGEGDMSDKLESEISATLNRHSAENTSNTPDYILAQYLLACLAAFDVATQQRETWYGRDARPSATAETPQPPAVASALVPCPACDGRGYWGREHGMRDAVCRYCDGTGKIARDRARSEKYPVTAPAERRIAELECELAEERALKSGYYDQAAKGWKEFRDAEALLKAGRDIYSDLNRHGKTLLDLYNVWLDHDRDRAVKAEARAERAEAALESLLKVRSIQTLEEAAREYPHGKEDVADVLIAFDAARAVLAKGAS
jgi:hypothetical protein